MKKTPQIFIFDHPSSPQHKKNPQFIDTTGVQHWPLLTPQARSHLPPNFSDEVLELEMLLENDPVDISVVNKLTELYTKAVEYYESIHNVKYVHFKTKIQKMMQRENVIKALSKKTYSSPKRNSLNETEREKMYLMSLRKKEYEFKLQNYKSNFNMGITANTIMNEYEKEKNKIDGLLLANLQYQDVNVKEKILLRKKFNYQPHNNFLEYIQNKFGISYVNDEIIENTNEAGPLDESKEDSQARALLKKESASNSDHSFQDEADKIMHEAEEQEYQMRLSEMYKKIREKQEEYEEIISMLKNSGSNADEDIKFYEDLKASEILKIEEEYQSITAQ